MFYKNLDTSKYNMAFISRWKDICITSPSPQNIIEFKRKVYSINKNNSIEPKTNRIDDISEPEPLRNIWKMLGR